jgi:hypothetical protein
VAKPLFASAGAGGVALTAWALRRSGINPRTVAERMIAFMTLIYVVFLGALIVGGFGLYLGILPGTGPVGVTLVPALVATFLVVLCLSVAFAPADFEWIADGIRLGLRMCAAGTPPRRPPGAHYRVLNAILYEVTLKSTEKA